MSDPVIILDEPTSERLSPELRLWRAGLAFLLSDAMNHWQGLPLKNINVRNHDGGQSAFEQVRDCGKQLRWICDHTGHDAEVVTEYFCRWMERNPQKVRQIA
jgi:hypothetical protein